MSNLLKHLQIFSHFLDHNFFSRPVRVVCTILSLGFCSAYIAGVFLRPEFIDGAHFVFDAINNGSPRRGYINNRTLTSVLDSWFFLIHSFPTSDVFFYPQRLLVNIWFAVVPVLTFAFVFLVLGMQRRSIHFAPMILIFGICVLLANGFHHSLVPETLSLGLAFVFLLPEDSKNIPLPLYFLFLIFSAQFVRGYEPFLIALPLAFSIFLARCWKAKTLFKSWHHFCFLLVFTYAVVQLVLRFKDVVMATGQLRQAIEFSSPTLFAMILFASTCLLSFAALVWMVHKPRTRRVSFLPFLAVLFAYFYFCTIYLKTDGFILFAGKFRFHATILLMFFLCCYFFLHKYFRQDQMTIMLKWTTFCILCFLTVDVKMSQDYGRLAAYRSSQLRTLSKGCVVFGPSHVFVTSANFLWQGSFRPNQVVTGCSFHPNPPPLEQHCNEALDTAGKKTFYCLNYDSIFMNRVSIQHLFSKSEGH